MCGFVVAYGDFTRDVIDEAIQSIRYRGPDATGYAEDFRGQLKMAHCRLSIRDVENGTQPMKSRDGRSSIVFNGEIYNDGELRRRLSSVGVQLRTQSSDTEVLLEALNFWGSGILKEIDGMFALVWSRSDIGEILLARDRFGQKPLYYSETDHGLIIGSESTALHTMANFSISESSIRDYLNYGYLVPPLTLAEGMFQCLPGYQYTYDVRNRALRSEPYWSGFKSLQVERHGFNLSELESKISFAVESRMVSERSVGMLLSGGIDSAIVALTVQQILGVQDSEDFKCTTVGFEDSSYDESHRARLLTYELELAAVNVEISQQSLLDASLTSLQALDEPLGDSSFPSTFLAFQAAAQSSIVVLTGDGGDELFLGYDPFRFCVSPLIPWIFSTKIGKGLAETGALVTKPSSSRLSRRSLLEKLANSTASPTYLVPSLMSPLTSIDARRIFGLASSDDFRMSHHDHLWQPPSSRCSIADLQRWFLTVYLPGSVLPKVDRASMLHGVEARPVYLENTLLEYSLATNSRYLLSPRQAKKPLRALIRDRGFRQHASAKKMGFGSPVAELMKTEVVEQFLDCQIPGINMQVAKEFALNHRRGVRDHRQVLYALLALSQSKSFRAMS